MYWHLSVVSWDSVLCCTLPLNTNFAGMDYTCKTLFKMNRFCEEPRKSFRYSC